MMLVLDRSGSMGASGGTDSTGSLKITSLKTAVNAFLGLQNTFSSNDRIGITSFASQRLRQCWRQDSSDTSNNCPLTKPWISPQARYISQLQTAVTGLCGGGTVAPAVPIPWKRSGPRRVPLAATYNDPARALTRKAVLLVTDGQPTFMRRDYAGEYRSQHRQEGAALPAPGNTGGPAVLHTWCTARLVVHRITSCTELVLVHLPRSPAFRVLGSNATLYRDVISCTRSITSTGAVNCVTKGAMREANQVSKLRFWQFDLRRRWTA